MMEQVILVDAEDNEIGFEEKLKAHILGKLHRAVSVFLFNSKQEFLLQQRALCKYHSGGLWSNTCCGHPRPGETPLQAAERRLWEEMGIRTPLTKSFEFTYQAKLDQGLFEHEFDHVFVGQFEGEPVPNPLEVGAWKWVDAQTLERDLVDNPQNYTVWFRIIISDLFPMTH